MPSNPLPNLLRMHRRRSGFSQDDISYLLGAQCGAKTCRYERNHRVPPLETAFGLEIIYQTSLHELFPGQFREVEERILSRANRLAHSRARKEQTPLVVRQLESLRKMGVVQES